MYHKTLLAAFTTFILTATVSTQGLYSKGSAVLQVDGKSYQKLIAKSNQVSVGFPRANEEVQILTDNRR
jgi:protein disulfide-isomerase A6